MNHLMAALSIISLVTFTICAEIATPWLHIDQDFPGGNIYLEGIEGDTIKVQADLTDIAPGWWFYWNFRVRGAQGRTLYFQTRNDILTNNGPAVSLDEGVTWTWLGPQSLIPGNRHKFKYTFSDTARSVRFSMGMPYVQSNLERFLLKHNSNPHIRKEILCRTYRGREVEMLHLGKIDGKAKYNILITCRHHACEMMASYAVEGLMEEVLSESETAKWLKQNVKFIVIPFMDKDGVENGDQGKRRRPHDHNRDYGNTSIYPEVIALKKYIPSSLPGTLTCAIDMHCPGIRVRAKDKDSTDERISIIHADSAFVNILKNIQSSPLVFNPSSKSYFSVSMTNEPKRDSLNPPLSCSGWAGTLPGIRLATTIELPYALVNVVEVTSKSAGAFGSDVARTIKVYLSQQDGNHKKTSKNKNIIPIKR